MSQFVEKLGVIAHLTADLNNPFNVPQADDRLRSMKSDFESYADSRTGVIPTVFYGLTYLSIPMSSWIAPLREQKATIRCWLATTSAAECNTTSADFDDRSTAFGIVALTYSHAVSDVVNVYYYIWQQAGGDVRSAAQMRHGTLLLNESAIFSPAPRPVNPQ